MIILKTTDEIDKLRKSCEIVAYVLKNLEEAIQPGITTEALNLMAEDLCFQKGGRPAFKGYQGFPYSICASKNHKIVHGFPDDNPLKSGEIISIDFGVEYGGWYGDSAFTKAVGEVPKNIERLLRVGEECLYAGIKAAKVNCKIGDISNAIQTHAEKHGYGVVKEYVGHGIGKNLHESPQIPNFGKPDTGYTLRAGSTVAIEPMINLGTGKTSVLTNDWEVVTADGQYSVHFEHTVAITKNGVEILTNRN